MKEIKEFSILAVASSLWFGGAQVVILEFFNLMKPRVKLKVLTCDGADPKFLDALWA
jgi:hypothetical protein